VARLRGFAGLPLIADDEIVGVLAMFFHERRSFSAEERELMALLADQAAIAIRNARLRQALRTRQAHLEALLEVSRQLSKIQPVESLLTTIAEACGRLLDSDTVGFRRVDGDELILAGSWGDARNVMITERLRMGESLGGPVAVGGEPLVVTDLANDPRVTPAHRASFHSAATRRCW
jgi:GAF domain-containing protein